MRHAHTTAQIAGRWLLAVLVLCSGCVQRDEALTYPFHDADVEYYKDVAQEIAYPLLDTPTPDAVAFSQAPRTVDSRDIEDVWDMSLLEAIHLALQNNKVVRSAGTFLSPGNPILTNGQNVTSVYDPAINESGVLFGNRGIEAALSAFDANFTTNMIWGRNELVQNNPFFGGGLTPGAALVTETGNFDSSLRKDFAYGGQVQLNHSVNYLGSNVPGQLFPSTYTGLVQALYRQPLWAGAGTEYTRIAGPITQQFGGLSGVTQGVVIARINNDISIADFEASIRNLVKDVVDTYWDLYLDYRNFETVVWARNSTLGVWQNMKVRKEVGAGLNNPAFFYQAQEQYFASEALVQSARSAIFTTETRLRRLLGLPVNEGRVIRPIETPITAPVVPDWEASLTDALVHRVELRKQKWEIKSLELQLVAARSLTRPRLDFVGGYQVNGFGDDLLAYDDDDGTTAQGLSNYYETITQGNQTGWSLGFEFNMPFGFRSAHAQVRNIELRLAKAHQVLYTQELEIAHELAVAFQELARAYETSRAELSRREAAIWNEEMLNLQIQGGGTAALGEDLIDQALRAQERRARAQSDFYIELANYNKALTNLQFRKGTLLQDTQVTLMEGGWDPDAYIDAYRRAQARTAAIDAPCKDALPSEFVSHAPVGTVEFARPIMPLPTEHVPLEAQPLPPATPPAPAAESDDVLPPPAEVNPDADVPPPQLPPHTSQTTDADEPGWVAAGRSPSRLPAQPRPLTSLPLVPGASLSSGASPSAAGQRDAAGRPAGPSQLSAGAHETSPPQTTAPRSSADSTAPPAAGDGTSPVSQIGYWRAVK